MKIHLVITFLLAATIVSSSVAYAQNITNSANSSMYSNLTTVIHPPLPQLGTINVTFNKTESGPMVITGTVHMSPSRPIVLTITGPQNNLILVSQMHPSSNGGFSLKFVPLAPLWSAQGNYTVTVSSGSQSLDTTTFYFNGTKNMANSSNSISTIPEAVLQSPTPILSPSEKQSVVNVALAVPSLQDWSHDWHYVLMGFGSNNDRGSSHFMWQYASVILRAPSSSAPIPCSNDWWATIVIDMTTMNLVNATYPTLESHPCQVISGGVPASIGLELSGNATYIESPLQQFKSGVPASEVECKQGFQLVIKAEDGSPACVKSDTARILAERGWVRNPLIKMSVLSSKIPPSETSSIVNTTSYQNSTLPVSFEPCQDPYPQEYQGIPILYMEQNSTGKICVRYHNLNDFPVHVGVSVFEAGNFTETPNDVTTWSDAENGTIGSGDSTVVYWLKTGGHKGLYGLTIFCVGMPFAVGYDNETLQESEFPWLGHGQIYCPMEPYDFHIDSTAGIRVGFIQEK